MPDGIYLLKQQINDTLKTLDDISKLKIVAIATIGRKN
jgi:hypothetical protein